MEEQGKDTTIPPQYLTDNIHLAIIMGKKHLLPQGNEEFLERLGLTEIDQKVYIATLDGGLVSLGEIQQLTDINDLGRILESVRDLIDIGLVKQAQGIMRRYYATLPFFRETLSIEREFRFALEAMLQSLNQAKENTTQNRERIMAIKFPKIIDDLLDRYYKEILSPVLNDLEGLREEINSNVMPFVKEVDKENSQIKEEISLMLKPLQNFTNLVNQNFDLGITNEQGELKQYIVNRKQARLDLLQRAHSALRTHFDSITSEISKLRDDLQDLKKAIHEELDQLEQTSQTISQQISSFEESAMTVNNAKKEIQAELVVAREQLKQEIAGGGDPNSAVDKIFSNLTGKIKQVDLNADTVVTNLKSVATTAESNSKSLQSTVSSLNQTITAIDARLTSSFEDLKTEMAEILNTLNDSDEESLQKLKELIELKMLQLADSIKDEGEKVISKLDNHMTTIKNRQEESLNHFQDKLVSLYSRPAEVISPFLDQWLDNIEPIIDDFKEESDKALIEILEPIQELESGTFSTLTERIGFVKAMIEGRSDDLMQVLEAAKEFDFTKSADTSVVAGLPAIYASLTDLLLRTKSKVTVVTPHLDLELLEVGRTLKSTVRISFVTDIDPEKDARIIKKMDEIGRINLRNYPERDLYACIRDSEEIVFGYIKDGEETIGIRSSTPSIVSLLQDRLNETVIRNSKPI